MDDEDILHWYRLIEEHKRHLRILEEKEAKYGKLDCPPYILTSMEDTQRDIKELEQRIRRRNRSAAEAEILYSAEEIGEIYDTIARIGQLEQAIPTQEGTIKILQEAFYRQYQSTKAKALIGLGFVVFVSPFIRVIGDIFSSKLTLRQKLPLSFSVITGFAGLMFYSWRWVKTELYGNIRDLELKLQANREELQRRKAKLNKIYQAPE